MRLVLATLAAAALAAFAALAAGAAAPTRAQLPLMVLPKPAYGPDATALQIDSSSGFRTNADAASDDINEHTTAARLAGFGRVTGYELQYGNALGSGRLVAAQSGVELFRDAAGARRYIAYERSGFARAAGKTQSGAKIERVSFFDVPGGFGARVEVSAGGLRVWLTGAAVAVGPVVAGVALTRRDAARQNARVAMLAQRLAARVQAALAGRLRGKPVTLPSSTKQKLGGLGRPKGGPDLAAMTLRSADLGGAHAKHAAYERNNDDVAEYEREFSSGRFRSSRLENVNCDVELRASAADGLSYFEGLRAVTGGPQGRAFLTRVFAAAAGPKKAGTTVVRIRPARTLAAGVPAFVIGADVRVSGLTLPVTILVVRAGAVVESLTIVAFPGRLATRDLAPLARLAAKRIRAALAAKD